MEQALTGIVVLFNTSSKGGRGFFRLVSGSLDFYGRFVDYGLKLLRGIVQDAF
jgi:hypothetical protein